MQSPAPPGHIKHGITLLGEGRVDEALRAFEQATADEPRNGLACYLLGICWLEKSDLQRALSSLTTAAELSPRNATVLKTLGMLHLQSGRTAEAEAVFRQVLSLDPQDSDAATSLARAIKAQGNVVPAAQMLEQWIESNPTHANAFVELGHLFRETGQTDAARVCYRRAVELDPSHWYARWNACLALPIVYASPGEIPKFRQLWNSGISELLNYIDQTKPAPNVPWIPPHTNFYLHYQCENDRREQEQFGSLVSKLVHRRIALPEPIRRPAKNSRKLRVGFLSRFFTLHTVFKLFHGWIKQLNRDRFEVYGFQVGSETDKATDYIRKHCDSFVDSIRAEERLAATVLQSELDVLVYPEIGMDPVTLSLAALRLAPVQCVAWGHPVTTGLPTIDYFLSSDLMEVAWADQHYTEKLVRLPNLSIWYPPPDLGIAQHPPGVPPKKGTVFLCLQSLFKLLPQYDEVFVRIASVTPGAEFWFIGLESPYVTGLFRDRLHRAFLHQDLDPNSCIRIFPKMPFGQFLGLIQQADIILDSIGWSGGNTTLEAIAFAKPIVTLPGEMMRSRHTYAILERIEIGETIARDVEDYIQIAIRLAADVAWREQISAKIRQNQKQLYNDRSAIAGLEQFLLSVTN